MRHTFALLALAAAIEASPFAMPQGVTAKISPSAPAPSGCMTDYASSFGIAVMNITATVAVGAKSDGQPTAGSSSAAKVSQISDGQPQAKTSAAAVTQISDGQPQAGTKTAAPVTQISDGQIQATTKTVAAVSQISDGQIQATTKTMMAITQISDGQIQGPTKTYAPVSQISDGQIQATKSATKSAVSQISDGQPQAPKSTATAVSQISDGQPQASKTSGVSQISDGQPQATGSSSSSNMTMVACKSGNGDLEISLKGGVLLDSQGRTGYIASNYQFQFDKPAQAGAIYTSGFSVCSNGSLALGGQTTWYQCLSGNFYNLYSVNWAPQCSPVNINVLNLINCTSS